MARFTEQIPERHRKGCVSVIIKADFGGTATESFMQFEGVRSGHSQPRQIALHIGHEHWNPGSRQFLGQNLQGHGFASAGCPGNQPVPVGVFQQHLLRISVAYPATTNKNPVTQFTHCEVLRVVLFIFLATENTILIILRQS